MPSGHPLQGEVDGDRLVGRHLGARAPHIGEHALGLTVRDAPGRRSRLATGMRNALVVGMADHLESRRSDRLVGPADWAVQVGRQAGCAGNVPPAHRGRAGS